jgi:hypothetical protein
MKAPRLLLGTLMALMACGEGTQGSIDRTALGETAPCASCHQQIVESFSHTAHFNTSADAGRASIKGDFSEDRNVLRTHVDDVWFEMEERDGGFYQTGYTRVQTSGIRLPQSSPPRSRTEPMHIVVGSGKVWQSYLYWKDDGLFQLPVSYLSQLGEWINSPGYDDGFIDFDRPILPRCLECHSTSFHPRRDGSGMLYTREHALGITCRKCHGDGSRHREYHTTGSGDPADRHMMNPADFSRQGQLDACALCHGGDRRPKQPPFSFEPGDVLDDFFYEPSRRDNPLPDVHGNQVGLLEGSACFLGSPDLTCSTCHDVHREERDPSVLATKCLGCHQVNDHPRAEEIGTRMQEFCVDCHMPRKKSDILQLAIPGRESFISYRSHAIAIYRDVADSILQARRPQ